MSGQITKKTEAEIKSKISKLLEQTGGQPATNTDPRYHNMMVGGIIYLKWTLGEE